MQMKTTIYHYTPTHTKDGYNSKKLAIPNADKKNNKNKNKNTKVCLMQMHLRRGFSSQQLGWKILFLTVLSNLKSKSAIAYLRRAFCIKIVNPCILFCNFRCFNFPLLIKLW